MGAGQRSAGGRPGLHVEILSQKENLIPSLTRKKSNILILSDGVSTRPQVQRSVGAGIHICACVYTHICIMYMHIYIYILKLILLTVIKYKVTAPWLPHHQIPFHLTWWNREPLDANLPLLSRPLGTTIRPFFPPLWVGHRQMWKKESFHSWLILLRRCPCGNTCQNGLFFFWSICALFFFYACVCACVRFHTPHKGKRVCKLPGVGAGNRTWVPWRAASTPNSWAHTSPLTVSHSVLRFTGLWPWGMDPVSSPRDGASASAEG